MREPETPERRPSAFAAAFFSAIQPGLGQIYAGRVMRGLLMAAPYVLAYALLGGIVLNHSARQSLEAQLVDPTWLLALLVVVAIDLIYRIVSALDAYRLALQPGRGGAPVLRLGSLGGLIAVFLVLVMAHAAVARPVYLAYDTLNTITSDNSPDSSAGDSVNPSDYVAAPDLPPTIAASQVPGASATPQPSVGPTVPPWTGNANQRLSILLVGVDAGRANEATDNTDTMIVVTIDPKTQQVGLISLPRDTGNIPLPSHIPAYQAYGGVYPSKINTLYNAARAEPNLFPYPGTSTQRGYAALMDTLGNLYGLNISYYVSVDLSGFRDAINALGGVMVDVQIPVNDPFYPADDGRGYLKLYIPPGFHHFDGAEALAYARSRHGLGNDYIRAARQERVVTSIREQFDLSSLFQPGVLNNLLSTLKQSVKTNIPPQVLPNLVSLAQQVDLNRRVSLVLSPPSYGSVCYPCPPSGLWMIKPNVSAMKQAVDSIFTESAAEQQQRSQLEAEGANVSVENGTTQSNALTTSIADALTTMGINASVPPVNGGAADKNTYTSTVITAYNGADQNMPTTDQVLAQTFGVTVQTATDPAQTADFVVVVGTDTKKLHPQQ